MTTKGENIYLSAIVHSKLLKCNIRLVHVRYKNKKGKQPHKLFFSTDTKLEALDILKFYQSRFQIEFLYRDGKQHTGLNDSQARSENKLKLFFDKFGINPYSPKQSEKGQRTIVSWHYCSLKD